MSSNAPPRPRVLVLDDEPPVARAIARVLKVRGFAPEIAHTAEAALELCAAGSFAVVVSDIGLPGMNGFDFVRALRQLNVPAPVIFLSGDATARSELEATRCGGFAYLTKPGEITRLPDEIARAMAHEAAARRPHASASVPPPGSAPVSALRPKRPGLRDPFREAVEQLYLVWQPVVSWSRRAVVGYEALVRSRHPTLAMPAALLEAAEQLGAVHEISHRVHDLVAAAVPEAPPGVLLFVNLHAVELLDERTYASPLAPFASRIVLEVTERAKLEFLADLPERLRKLRAAGYTTALDDLGAGYAGLGSLATLAPQIAKLDLAVVRDVDASETKQKLIRSVLSLCRDLEIALLAEGVETPAERDVLASLGIDWMQGYLFGQPAPTF